MISDINLQVNLPKKLHLIQQYNYKSVCVAVVGTLLVFFEVDWNDGGTEKAKILHRDTVLRAA